MNSNSIENLDDIKSFIRIKIVFHQTENVKENISQFCHIFVSLI